MDARVAVISIIVEDIESVEQINILLHQFSQFIIGRMGIPYREKNINIISVVLDAPPNKISSLAGKIGNLNGVSVKTSMATR